MVHDIGGLSDLSPFAFALLSGLFASLGTALGGGIVFLAADPGDVFVANANSAAAGVMMFISIFDIIPEVVASIGLIAVSLAFIVGVALFTALQQVVHSSAVVRSASITSLTSGDTKKQSHAQLLLSASLTTVTIALHNAPEGLSVLFVSLGSVESRMLGIPLIIGICLHNVVEGAICSVSMYSATKSKSKSFLVAGASGLTEPLTIILGYFFFSSVITPFIIGISLAAVAGVMVSLSIFELLPIATRSPVYSYYFIGGLIVTAIPVAIL
jgi:zinc transporter, ZIP family